MTTATTNTTLTTLVASSPPTASSFSNLQLLQHATNLANPLAPYPTDLISTLPESSNSLFPNSVYTLCTTTTHTTISSPEFPPFQQQTVPGSGQVPVHQHYLSSQINTNTGNSNIPVNDPVTSQCYHPYDSVELEKESNYPPAAGKQKKHHHRDPVAIDFIADDHARSATYSKRKTTLLKKVGNIFSTSR